MPRLDELMQPVIVLAREQYGEREYTYRRISHNWRRARRRGEKGGWFTTIGVDPVTREVYEANVEQGKADSRLAFRLELNKRHYYSYVRDKVRDGWQDALISFIEEVPADDPS
jgi:hypothetical protein